MSTFFPQEWVDSEVQTIGRFGMHHRGMFANIRLVEVKEDTIISEGMPRMAKISGNVEGIKVVPSIVRGEEDVEPAVGDTAVIAFVRGKGTDIYKPSATGLVDEDGRFYMRVPIGKQMLAVLHGDGENR